MDSSRLSLPSLADFGDSFLKNDDFVLSIPSVGKYTRNIWGMDDIPVQKPLYMRSSMAPSPTEEQSSQSPTKEKRRRNKKNKHIKENNESLTVITNPQIVTVFQSPSRSSQQKTTNKKSNQNKDIASQSSPNMSIIKNDSILLPKVHSLFDLHSPIGSIPKTHEHHTEAITKEVKPSRHSRHSASLRRFRHVQSPLKHTQTSSPKIAPKQRRLSMLTSNLVVQQEYILPLPRVLHRRILKTSVLLTSLTYVPFVESEITCDFIERPDVISLNDLVVEDQSIIKYIREFSRESFYSSYKKSVSTFNRTESDVTDRGSGKVKANGYGNGNRSISSVSVSVSVSIEDMDYNNTPTTPGDANTVITPRSMYLRKVDPTSLSLAHKGLGDQQALIIIEVIDHMKDLLSLNLCDNRLTDISLMPLLEKLDKLEHLTHLDLSFNKIDESSELITSYLMVPHCADVDDGECCNIAKALHLNESVTTLSLTNNLIGSNETRNFTNPNLVTGPEAIGAMLLKNRTLTSLDLSWNFIRKDSAVTIAEALLVNKTLKRLLLANNGFGDHATKLLGQSLKKNISLRELDLSFNALTPCAAAVLANSLVLNEFITSLDVRGNVLGRIGSQALVAAVQRVSTFQRTLSVSFGNCDCEVEDSNVFDPKQPYINWTYQMLMTKWLVKNVCIYVHINQ
eukprot:gene8375-17271_t